MNKTLLIILSTIVTYFIYTKFVKSQFNDKLSGQPLTNEQPRSFPGVNPSTEVPEFPPLVPPVVPEEIGLAMVYPQGPGVGMSKMDSNSFTTSTPGPLLSDYTIPESYGESSLTDPFGNQGAEQSARILKIGSTGEQSNFKPIDETECCTFSSAYTKGEVTDNYHHINGSKPINYTDSYNPSTNLKLQSSPGMSSTLPNCETTYPNVVKYNNFCITEGDIPYGQVVDNKVNPRLVDRWQSFTGDYSRAEALSPIDGTLYPNLNVLTSA